MKLFLMLAASILFAVSAIGQTKSEETPTLRVTGEAQVRVTPDVATVRLGVVAQSDTAQKAQDEANKAIQAFLARLQTLKIGKENIQTSNLTLNPMYSNRPNEPQRIIGFQASNDLSVTVTNFGLIGGVIDAGVASGVNSIQGVEFGLRDSLKARTDALQAAVKEARAKAEAMAQAAGVTLGPLKLVEEGFAQVIHPQMQVAMAGRSMPPVEPGQVGVTMSVTLAYSIGSGK